MYELNDVNFCDDCDDPIEKPHNLCKQYYIARHPRTDPNEIENVRIPHEEINYPDDE